MLRLLSIILLFFFTQPLIAQNLKFEWARQVGSDLTEWVYSIGLDNEGNIYLTGNIVGSADFDPGPGVFILSTNGGSMDIFVCKLDPAGNFIWAKLIGGPMEDSGTSLIIDPDGNLVLAGFFSGTADFDPSSAVLALTSFGDKDIFISKLTNNGNHLWTKQIGGPSIDYCSSVKTDGAGNIYYTGFLHGLSDFDPGPGLFNLTPVSSHDNFISRLDGNGNFSWAILAGGNGENFPSIDVDVSGNIVATGSFAGTHDFDPGPLNYNLTSVNNSTDVYISKYSNNGNFIWAKQIAGSSSEMGRVVKLGSSGNIYVCGDFLGSVDFNPGTSTNLLTSFGSFDIFITKLDLDGNSIWTKQMGGNGQENAYGLAISDNESVFSTGGFTDTADFDSGNCNFPLNPFLNGFNFSGTNAFLSKIDSSGNFKWAKSYGGNAHVISADIIVNETGSVYTAGHFSEPADFDPGPGSYILDPMPFNVQSMFIQKLSPCINSTSSNILFSSCGTFTIGCQTITNSGIYTHIQENSIGCDSIITMNVTMGSVMTNASVFACNSFDFNGQFLTSSGVYYDTIHTENGCDSIIQLNLQITNSPLTVIYLTACNSYYWDGQELTSSGLYKDTLTTANGCDSIIHLNLNIMTSKVSETTLSACTSFIWNGNVYATSGVYRDTFVSNASCDSIAVLQLTIHSTVNSMISQNICKGQSFEGYTSTGIYTDSFNAANGCDSIRTIQLTVTDPPSPDLGPDKEICLADSIKISPGQFSSYLWQDGSTDNFFFVKQQGTYAVTVSNSCGTGTDGIIITEGICDLSFPNAFTPNQDGKNDEFKALGNPALGEYSLSVFNRWGQRVFKTTEQLKGWNGTFNGKTLATGNYVWICIYRKAGSNEKTTLKGNVFLIQ